MQDSFPIPSCFSSGEKLSDDPTSATAAATKSGQTVVMSVYRTKIAGRSRLVTVTWCRNLLVHGLSVSVEGSSDGDGAVNSNDTTTTNTNMTNTNNQYAAGCKVELRPWYFWRKHGSKRFSVEGRPIEVFWDLRNASFSGDPEPRSDYYVAVVASDEVVLLLGDLRKDAYRRSSCRPAAIEALLVAKKEHVFGKKRFSTRAKFHEKGRHHDISIECNCTTITASGGGAASGSGGRSNVDTEMVIKIDGNVAIHVKHLQWKFRGNQSISISKNRVEVYWDVHDWLFSPGMRQALFIFKPNPTPGSSMSTPPSSSSLSSLFSSSSIDGGTSSSTGGTSTCSGSCGSTPGFCLFLYAWKLE